MLVILQLLPFTHKFQNKLLGLLKLGNFLFFKFKMYFFNSIVDGILNDLDKMQPGTSGNNNKQQTPKKQLNSVIIKYIIFLYLFISDSFFKI